MKMQGNLVVLLVVLMGLSGGIEGASVTCEPEYGFLPCTTEIWGRLFLIVVYQALMSVGQKYISDGSDQFFRLIGPGIFGASMFHILGTLPMLFLILESGLSSDDVGAAINAGMGMSVLAGSAVISLTLIWPSCVAFGNYDLSEDDPDSPQTDDVEPSFFTKLTGYGISTDQDTSSTARIMLVSMIPFIILQLPKIINSPSVTRVIVLLTLILALSLFIGYIVYQVFQPWIQNRRFDYVTQKFVKNKLLKLLSTNGKPNVRLIKDVHKGLDKNHDGKVSRSELRLLLLGIQLEADGQISNDFIDRIMEQFDISGDETIQEDEFVRILTKWLRDARSMLSKNDYNPLRFFIKPVGNTDEEQQQALIPKKTNANTQGSVWEYLGALSLVLLGTIISALFAQPLIMNVANFASATNVPSFLIPYCIIPSAINIPRLLSTIQSASQKTQRAASLTLSQIYAGVFMNSMSSLSVFLLIVYIRDVPWDVSAEVLVVLIIYAVMGIFTSTKTVFPLWTSYVVYLMYPISLLMLYLLTVVWGWS